MLLRKPWAGRNNKVTICHFPPGNPDNWHTITISERAVARHIARHGDLIGSCQSHCAALCDDGNACTKDVASFIASDSGEDSDNDGDSDSECNRWGNRWGGSDSDSGDDSNGDGDSDSETCECLPTPRPPVDCDDGDACTINDCDPVNGCGSAPVVCTDDDACTAEVCAEGVCVFPPISCGDGEVCDSDIGCFDPCAGVTCDPTGYVPRTGHLPGGCDGTAGMSTGAAAAQWHSL